MTPICKGHTKERIDRNHNRVVKPCVFAAKAHGYCVHHNPFTRRKHLERQKRHLSDSLNRVLTELIEVTAIIEEINTPQT